MKSIMPTGSRERLRREGSERKMNRIREDSSVTDFHKIHDPRKEGQGRDPAD